MLSLIEYICSKIFGNIGLQELLGLSIQGCDQNTTMQYATMEGRLRACCRHNRVNLAVNISSVHQINSQPCCVAMICPALRKHVTHLKPKILSQLCDRQFSFRDNDNITQHADPLHRGLLPAGKLFLFLIRPFDPRHIKDKSRSSCNDAVNTPTTWNLDSGDPSTISTQQQISEKGIHARMDRV